MVRIRVPATSANLGPGFDCLGLALNLYAYFDFSPQTGGPVITGCAREYAGEDNLVYRAYLYALASRAVAPRGLRLHINSAIAPSRGLGSSAACIVAGILGASCLHGLKLSREEVFELAARMEGHPDNAAAAVYGGLRVSLMEEGQAMSLPCRVHPLLRFAALVPDFELRTSLARAALRDFVPLGDAVFNVGHTAFLIKALEGDDPQLIRPAMRDKLHQDARFALIPGAAALKERMEGEGALACCLSGAGSSLLCLYTDPAFEARAGRIVQADFPGFSVAPLKLCLEGAVVVETEKG